VQKIAMIHPNLFERGGAERKLILISRELQALGYAVDIIVNKYNKHNTFHELIDSNLNIVNLSQKRKLKWFWSVVKTLRRCNYNLIVAHNYPANIPVGIYKVLFHANVKTIWVCNEVATLLNRKSGIIWGAYYSLERYLVSFFNLIVANSSYTASSIRNYYLSEPTVVRSGVEVRNIMNSDNMPDLDKRIGGDYLFSLSRIEKHKNLELLEKLAKHFERTNIKIVVAGKGSDVSYLRDLENRYENILYLGGVSEDEKFYLYHNAKAFLFLPKAEPLGVTVMEAISQNTPVIAYNNGGPKEVILDKENGFLSNNDKEYIENVECILVGSFIVSDGKQYIQKEFSNQRMTGDFVRIFQDMMDN